VKLRAVDPCHAKPPAQIAGLVRDVRQSGNVRAPLVLDRAEQGQERCLDWHPSALLALRGFRLPLSISAFVDVRRGVLEIQ
jgi:hypothetical protein